MKNLEVTLDYSTTDSSLSSQGQDKSLSTPFPFRVVDAHGGLVAEGAVNSHQSKRIQFSDPGNNSVLFVRLVWPNGRSSTQVANFDRLSGASVRFSDETVGADDWAKWAAPRIASRTTRAQLDRAGESVISRFKNVWLRLWTNTGSEWKMVDGLPRERREENSTARQFDLLLGEGSHLLQIGGAQVPWVFVSLPGKTPCRVFLTPNESSDPRSLPLKVVVTSFRPEAETIVEFLSRDALRAAESVGQFAPVATKLLEAKFEDAISAFAGAYYLLRIGGWKDTPVSWFDNLYNFFKWSSDAALIRCVLTLRKGLTQRSDTEKALQQLYRSMDGGLPLFEEGHRLLLEACALLRGVLFPPEGQGTNSGLIPARPLDYAPLLGRCEALAAARAWTGPAFSFFGSVPDQPSALRLKGAPPDVGEPSQDGDPFGPGMVMYSAKEVLSFEGSSVPSPRRRSKKRSSVTYLKDL